MLQAKLAYHFENFRTNKKYNNANTNAVKDDSENDGEDLSNRVEVMRVCVKDSQRELVFQ